MKVTKRTIFGGVSALAMSVVAVAGGIAYADSRSKLEVAAANGFGFYTQNYSRAARATVLHLRLDLLFEEGERAAILRAVAEWNHVLNGHVRFDVEKPPAGRPLPYIPGVWTIARLSQDADAAAKKPVTDALAVTLRLPKEGGIIIVHTDRLVGVDMRRVMLHELGHTLGLEHDPRSHLMAVRYIESEHQCIDRATVELLATHLQLPLNELNWCTAKNTVWSSYRDERTARPWSNRSRVSKAS